MVELIVVGDHEHCRKQPIVANGKGPEAYSCDDCGTSGVRTALLVHGCNNQYKEQVLSLGATA
jgi:hypothetical protein